MLDFFLERSVYIYEKYFEMKFSYLINMGNRSFSELFRLDDLYKAHSNST